MDDLIKRADAINAVHKYFVDKINNEPHEIDEDGDDVFTDMKSVNALFHHNKMVSKAIKALPSADADGEDLIIKGAKGIQDGLYNIKDGKLFKYKAKGGTVRTYPIVPSADAVQGEWIPCSERLPSESDDYLCTIPLDADETYTSVLTFHKGRFYEDDDEWGATYHDDVLAWMPLPDPYKDGAGPCNSDHDHDGGKWIDITDKIIGGHK